MCRLVCFIENNYISSHRQQNKLIFKVPLGRRRKQKIIIAISILTGFVNTTRPSRIPSRNRIWMHCSFLYCTKSGETSSIWSININSGFVLLLSVCSSSLYSKTTKIAINLYQKLEIFYWRLSWCNVQHQIVYTGDMPYYTEKNWQKW